MLFEEQNQKIFLNIKIFVVFQYYSFNKLGRKQEKKAIYESDQLNQAKQLTCQPISVNQKGTEPRSKQSKTQKS